MRRREFLKLGGIGLAAGRVALPAGKQPAEATPANRWTPVHRVRTLANLNVRVGPSTAYRRIGLLWAGHTTHVLAVSANYR
ncbi:MAG: hypothetical protein NTZ50_03160 [Chloroflexi bacterium]|nr:hypothetical protein [Chloroflexota bacterium]